MGLALDSHTLNVNIHFSALILGGLSNGEWYRLTTIQVPQNSLARTLVGYDSIHSHTEQWDQKLSSKFNVMAHQLLAQLAWAFQVATWLHVQSKLSPLQSWPATQAAIQSDEEEFLAPSHVKVQTTVKTKSENEQESDFNLEMLQECLS